MRALEGITVVAVEQAVAAPLATRHLADLGARVIKVERVDGGDFAREYDHAVKGQAAHFVWLNRSKESIALDLSSEAGVGIVRRLIDSADVFLQNLAPGAAARLGLGSQELRATRPRLVTVDMSGYGPGGPYANKKAYDMLVQSEAGLIAMTGSPESPAKTGVAAADIAAGLVRVLRACSPRCCAAPRPARVATSTSACSTRWWSGWATRSTPRCTPAQRRRGQGSGMRRSSRTTAIPTLDGGRLLIGVQNDRQWVAFVREVLEKPELATDPRYATNVARVARRAEVDGAHR